MSSDTSMDLLDDAEIIGRLEQVIASLGSGVGMDNTLEDEEIGGRLEDVLTTLGIGIAGGNIPQEEEDLPMASQLTVSEDNVASEPRRILTSENVSENVSVDGDRSPLVASDRLLYDNQSERSDNENVACRKGLPADVAMQDCSQPEPTGSEDHALRCTLSEISLANSAWSEISGPEKDYMHAEISNISSPVENPSSDGGAVYIESWDKDEETPADPSGMDPSLQVSLCSDANETSSDDRPVSILPDKLFGRQMENATHEPVADLNINVRLDEKVESKSNDVDDTGEIANTQSASCQQDVDNMEDIPVTPDVGQSSSYADVPDSSNSSLPEDPTKPETNIDPGGKDVETVGKDLHCSDNEENPEKTAAHLEKLEEPPLVSENPNKSCDTELSEIAVGPGDIHLTEVQDFDPSNRDIPDMLFRPENPTPFHENPELVDEDVVELPSEDCAVDSELPEFPVVEIIPYEDEGSRLQAELTANFSVPASTTSSVTVPTASATGFPPGISVVDVGRIFPSPRSVTRLKHKTPEFIDIDNLPDCDSADAIDSDAPVEPVHVKTENADAAAVPFSEDPSERPMCFCPHGFTSRTVGHHHCRYCGLSCRSRSSLRSHEARQHETPVASNTPASTQPAEKNSDAGRKKKSSKAGAVIDDAHPKCRCELGFRSEFSQQGHFHCRCCGFSSRYRTAVTQHESLLHRGHTDLIGKRRRNPSENRPSSISPSEAEGATPPTGMTTRNREKSPSEKRIRTGSMVSLSHLSTFSDGKSAATAGKSTVLSDGATGKTPTAESSEMELSENPDDLTTVKTEVIEGAGRIIGTVLEKPPESSSNSFPTSDADQNVTNDKESANNSDNTVAVGQSTVVTVATDGSEQSMKVDGYSGPLEIPTEVVRGKKVKCPLCVLRFVRIDTLRNHLICVHDILPAGYTRYSCLPCKFDTSYRYIFAGHCSSQMHATVLSSCRIISSDGAGAGYRADVGSIPHIAEADGSTKTDCINLESNNSVEIASQTPSTRQQPHDVAQLQPEAEPSDQVSTVPENISVPECISSSPKQVPSSKTDQESSESKSDRIRWFYSGGKSSSVSKQKFFDIETFLPPIVWQHSVEHACSEECATKTTRQKRPTTKTENGMSKTRHSLRTRKTSTDGDCKRRLENTVADTKRSRQEEIVLIPSGSESATNSPHRSTEQKRSLRSTARKSTGSLKVNFGFGKRKSDRVGGSSPAERVTLRESRRSDSVGRIQQEHKTSSSPLVAVDYQSSSRQLRSKSELLSKDETPRRKSSTNNATTADSKSDPSLTMKSVQVTTGKRTPVVELSRTRSAAPAPKSGSQNTPAKKHASPPPPVDTHNISDDDDDDLEILENPTASAALGKSGSEKTIAGSDAMVAAVSQFQQTLLTWANAASCLTGAILQGESAEKRRDNPAGSVTERIAHGSIPSAYDTSGRRSFGRGYRVEVISAPTNVVVIDDEIETNFRVDAGSSTGTGSVPTLSRSDLNTSQCSADVPASSSYSSTAGTKSWTYFEPSRPTVSLQSSVTVSSASVGNPSTQPSLLSGRLTSASSTFSPGSISTAAWAAIGQSNSAAAQRGRPTPFLPSMASVSSWSVLGQTRPTLSVIGGRSVVSLERFSTDNLWAELCRRGTVRSCTCGMYFMDTTLYMLHRSCHCDTAPLRCAFCDHSSANNYDFHAHLLDHKK